MPAPGGVLIRLQQNADRVLNRHYRVGDRRRTGYPGHQGLQQPTQDPLVRLASSRLSLRRDRDLGERLGVVDSGRGGP